MAVTGAVPSRPHRAVRAFTTASAPRRATPPPSTLSPTDPDDVRPSPSDPAAAPSSWSDPATVQRHRLQRRLSHGASLPASRTRRPLPCADNAGSGARPPAQYLGEAIARIIPHRPRLVVL
ncbi:uncharacterized protein [Miscanthus floridulus]|uniref:uncharacterized protein n=1 Tax=Miscanthus floridulus TaxID=154761 RepID=UPI00345A683D